VSRPAPTFSPRWTRRGWKPWHLHRFLRRFAAPGAGDRPVPGARKTRSCGGCWPRTSTAASRCAWSAQARFRRQGHGRKITTAARSPTGAPAGSASIIGAADRDLFSGRVVLGAYWGRRGQPGQEYARRNPWSVPAAEPRDELVGLRQVAGHFGAFSGCLLQVGCEFGLPATSGLRVLLREELQDVRHFLQ
jgi:hypothetical protein